MEVMVYRNQASGEVLSDQYAGGHGEVLEQTGGETPPEVQSSLQPDVFYPCITNGEWETWRYWLPTTLVFDRKSWRSPTDIVHALTHLQAPPEVLEEFQWADKLEMFDTYEIRTPERRDLRDPLLLGRCGDRRYRMALWGESLRPLDEITSLVQQSLVIRQRAATWRRWLITGGTLGGFAFGLWLGGQPTFEGDPFATGFLFGLLGLFFTVMPLLANTPENRQHTFLDRYRS